PSARLVLDARARLVEVEPWVGRRVDEGLRLAFVLVVEEEVDPILPDRTAERRAHLLIGVGEHAVGDRILRVEAIAAEVPGEAARGRVGARLADGVQLHAARPSLRRVEAVGDELELRDGVAAVARVAEG